MLGKLKWFVVLTTMFWSSIVANGYQLVLNDNSPVISGANVTLNATVLDNKGSCVKGQLIFRYEDAFPTHKVELKQDNCEALFHIPFKIENGPSSYSYKVDVLEQILIPIIDIPIASGSGQLTITENLNGQLQLFQNNTNISKNSSQTIYVSSSLEIVHKIELNPADLEYLNTSANSITVYWFIDCIYQGNTTNYTFSSNYTQAETQHEVLGIVVADFGPPTPPPLTTTASPNDNNSTTSVATTTITAVTSTTNTSTGITPALSTVFLATTTTALPKTNEKSFYHNINSTFTSDCQQKKPLDLLLSAAQLEKQQKYGYFRRSLLVKDPIANVKIQGKVWIQEGEVFSLQVSCNGSGPFRYCAHYSPGISNVTANETCPWERNLIQCQMQFIHYFHEPTNYTLVVIIANDVSKIVTPIGIHIYKVNKQPQISVIVVPVTFSSIAVIIVVFGIAYYFQNRSRYMVEVADFDFANNSDMEYKTFRERLRDAISQAINRTQDYSEYDGSEEQIGSATVPQNQKYGSMQ